MRFIYLGTLFRDVDGKMEFYRRVKQGQWEWTPVPRFRARKIRRIVAMRKVRQ